MGTPNSTGDATARRRPYGLLSNVAMAAVVGIVLGSVAASTGGVGGLAALGVVTGVAVGLGGMAAVPALLRLWW